MEQQLKTLKLSIEGDAKRREGRLNIVLQAAQHDQEVLISATPTGSRRNQFTEANIHLTEAINKMRGFATINLKGP